MSGLVIGRKLFFRLDMPLQSMLHIVSNPR